MSDTLEKLKSKLEEANLDEDLQNLLQEAVYLIERQQGASLDLQASITRFQKRYSELERNVPFREFSGVAVWYGDRRLCLVEDKRPYAYAGGAKAVLRLLDKAKAEFQILTESQNAQNHPKQD
jgi:hypothetical protein